MTQIQSGDPFDILIPLSLINFYEMDTATKNDSFQ